MIFKAIPLFTPEQREMIEIRSGNPKSLEFPCEVMPKSVKHLRNAAPNTGHDLHLNGLFLLVDFVASKRLKVLLLSEYGRFINVVSGASLMHRPDLADVPVDDISCLFRYGMSVMMNLRLIKKMCAEISTIREVDEELEEFVVALENTLTEYNIKIPEPVQVDFFNATSFCKTQDPLEDIACFVTNREDCNLGIELEVMGMGLSLYEQILRYSSGTLIPHPRYDGLFGKEYKIGDRLFSCTIIMTPTQAKMIIDQRKTHKLLDWHVICESLEVALTGS